MTRVKNAASTGFNSSILPIHEVLSPLLYSTGLKVILKWFLSMNQRSQFSSADNTCDTEYDAYYHIASSGKP